MQHTRTPILIPILIPIALALHAAGCSHIGKPRVIYIARHGQTEWNRKARFQGDPDLDSVGYINRVSLWKLTRKRPIAAIYTSERLRTRRTAELVARQHKIPIQPLKELNEIDPGIFEGLCYSQVVPGAYAAPEKQCAEHAHSSHPEATLRYARATFKTGWADRVDGKLPLGQSFRELVEQVQPFVKRLDRGLKQREVLVIGHGVVNRALLHLLLGWPLQSVAKLRQGNDQVYKLAYPGPRLFLYTPGVGWRPCTKPPKPGDRHLDCDPGEGTPAAPGPAPAESPKEEPPTSAPAPQTSSPAEPEVSE